MVFPQVAKTIIGCPDIHQLTLPSKESATSSTQGSLDSTALFHCGQRAKLAFHAMLCRQPAHEFYRAEDLMLTLWSTGSMQRKQPQASSSVSWPSSNIPDMNPWNSTAQGSHSQTFKLSTVSHPSQSTLSSMYQKDGISGNPSSHDP